MTGTSQPSHELIEVKELVRSRRFKSTSKVLGELYLLRLDEDDIHDCLLSLEPSHFRETRASDRDSSVMVDIYRVPFAGRWLYVKFHLGRFGDEVVLLSFHKDGSR